MPPAMSSDDRADVGVAVAVAREQPRRGQHRQRHRPHEAGREPLRALLAEAEDAAHVGHGDVDDRRRHDRGDRADHHRRQHAPAVRRAEALARARRGNGRVGRGHGGGGRGRPGRLSPRAASGRALATRSRRAAPGARYIAVARLDAERRIERRVVAHRPVDAEFVGRVRIGLDLRDQRRLARLAAMALREAVEETLVATHAVDHGRGLAFERAVIRLEGDLETGVVGDVLAERELAVDRGSRAPARTPRTARPASSSLP